MDILIETSARHIHLNKETLELLCGKDFKLTPVKKLSQPGYFVSQLRLEIVGPKKSIKNVSVLGPLRKENQIEISITDAINLGIKPLIRESGNTNGSSPIKIIEPIKNKEINLKEGAIIAKRHIHMNSKNAKKENLKDGDIVKVKIKSQERSIIFGDVIIRVNDNFSTCMHIDTDESNAANISNNNKTYGEIIKYENN